MPPVNHHAIPVGRRKRGLRFPVTLNESKPRRYSDTNHQADAFGNGLGFGEIIFDDPDSDPIPTTLPDSQQPSNAPHRKSGKRRGDRPEENQPPATAGPSTTNETKKGKKKKGSKTKNTSNRESKKSRQNKQSTDEKKKAEEVEEEGEPIARSIRRVQKARDKVSRAQWKLSPLALKYFTKGMHDKPEDNRSVQGLMNAKATHFMNKPEFTKLCIERVNEKHMPCDSKIQNVNEYSFVYECNILQNTHDTRKIPLRGESVLFDQHPAVISAQTSDPAKALYNAPRNQIGASRYLSVIFPLNELNVHSITPGSMTAAEKIKRYFNDFKEDAFNRVLSSIQTMAQYNSDINWTIDGFTRFDTSDYSTYLCEAEGILENINNDDDPIKYRVMIYRRVVLTGFKESEILTKGNIVMCEEVIIQLQTSGESPNNDAVTFKNTESCLVFSARNSLGNDNTSMHFQGHGAFSVDIPSTEKGKFNPMRRDHDVMTSFGWLVNKINESTKNDDDSVGRAADFFKILIDDENVQKAAKAQANKNKKDDATPQQGLAQGLGRQPDNGNSLDRLTLIENSFIAHQKTVLLQARSRNSSIHCIDWVSGPSFALAVLSPSSDGHIRYLVLKTYHILGNAQTDQLAYNSCDNSSYRTCTTDPSSSITTGNNSPRQQDSGKNRNSDEETALKPRASHDLDYDSFMRDDPSRYQSQFRSLITSSLPEELELELELI
jgi:hypothetical protein